MFLAKKLKIVVQVITNPMSSKNLNKKDLWKVKKLDKRTIKEIKDFITHCENMVYLIERENKISQHYTKNTKHYLQEIINQYKVIIS